jgi:hypothetical protein
LTAVAVGGFSLSRGLTLEGLCVSYMYRNTSMYDTLMQMGRWFGYRPGYEDLCRIYLSEESIAWYRHIAEATNDLKKQIKTMSYEGATPKEFGFRVRTHPDRLSITAADKMRNAKIISLKVNFSGALVESYRFMAAPAINANNEALIREYWQNNADSFTDSGKGLFGEDMNIVTVAEFLKRFQVHPSLEGKKSGVIEYLFRISDKHPKADVLLISIENNDADLASYRLGVQKRNAILKDGTWEMPKARVASRGDEKLGLTDAQKKEAEERAEQMRSTESGQSNELSDRDYRAIRNKPLLMLHILEFPDDHFKRVPAFGISFPYGDYVSTVEVALNPVGAQRPEETIAGGVDEEEIDD